MHPHMQKSQIGFLMVECGIEVVETFISPPTHPLYVDITVDAAFIASPEESEWIVLNHPYSKYEAHPTGYIRKIDSHQVLQVYHNASDFYPRVALNRTLKRLHKIIATAFLGDCPEGCVVHHKDFDVKNNSISNLEYIKTDYHIAIHSIKHSIARSKNIHTYTTDERRCKMCGATYCTRMTSTGVCVCNRCGYVNDGAQIMTSEVPECPKCKGKDVRYRRTDGLSWCRKCGHEWKKEEKK